METKIQKCKEMLLHSSCRLTVTYSLLTDYNIRHGRCQIHFVVAWLKQCISQDTSCCFIYPLRSSPSRCYSELRRTICMHGWASYEQQQHGLSKSHWICLCLSTALKLNGLWVAKQHCYKGKDYWIPASVLYFSTEMTVHSLFFPLHRFNYDYFKK